MSAQRSVLQIVNHKGAVSIKRRRLSRYCCQSMYLRTPCGLCWPLVGTFFRKSQLSFWSFVKLFQNLWQLCDAGNIQSKISQKAYLTLYSLKFHFSWTHHVIRLLCFYCFYLLSSESISNDSFGSETIACLRTQSDACVSQLKIIQNKLFAIGRQSAWHQQRTVVEVRWESWILLWYQTQIRGTNPVTNSFPVPEISRYYRSSPSSSQSSHTIREWCVCGGWNQTTLCWRQRDNQGTLTHSC